MIELLKIIITDIYNQEKYVKDVPMYSSYSSDKRLVRYD